MEGHSVKQLGTFDQLQISYTSGGASIPDLLSAHFCLDTQLQILENQGLLMSPEQTTN